MICKNCAAEYDDSYSFCPVCGKEKFSVEVPEYPEYPEYVPSSERMEFTDISSFSDDVIRAVAEEYLHPEEKYTESNDNAGYYNLDADEDEHTDTYAYDEAPAEIENHEATQIFSLEADAEGVADEYTEEAAADVAAENPEEIAEEAMTEAADETDGEASDEVADEAEAQGEGEIAAPEYEGGASAQPEGDDASGNEAAEEPEKQPVRRPVRRAPAVNKKEENRSLAIIIAIMCVVAVLAGVLSGLKISTDTLETTEPAQKVVASLGFSTQEEIMLEEVVARCFSALRTDYNSELTDAEDFLKRVNIYDKGGVYSRIYEEYPKLNTAKDPADRFYNDEVESYAYYKIEEKKIDDLMSIFGIAPHHQINTENCYYYDGYYYFAPVVQKATVAVNAEIMKSKRALDGSYYSECYFYAENSEKRVQTDTYYLVTEKIGDIQSGTISFKIKRISTTPIYEDNGKAVEERTYKIKKQVIEGKTDDGKVYCRYTFEYPEFNGNSAGYQAINTFFTDAISVYKLKADSAQKSYESFIRQGGKDSELPIEESVIARVSYENEKYVSVVEKIGIADPTSVKSVAAAQTDDEENDEEAELTLFERMVDGYVFDKATGSFVSKDVLVGKDYLAVSEILYRIYNSYDYESIIPDATDDDEDYYYDDDDDVPYDEDGFGTIIYESACAFTGKGLTFFYVNEHDFVEEVTIPHAVVEKLTQQQ